MMSKWWLSGLLVLVSLPLFAAEERTVDAAGTGQGPGGFPDREMTLIVPFAAGGGMDICARILAKYMTEEMGQPVRVVNRTDGGNIKGNLSGVEAPPDGYTLTFWGRGLVTDQLIIKDVPYTYEDVLPICLVAQDPHVITVRRDMAERAGIANLEDLFAYVRQHPMEVTFGLGGNWTTHDLLRVKMERQAGVKFNRMPFLGGALALQAALAGNCDVVVPMLAEIVPVADSRAILPLAVSFNARQAVLADVPTVAEAGYPDLVETVWRVISAPRETPPDIVAYLESVIGKVSELPEYQAETAAAGVNSYFLGHDETVQFVADQYGYYLRATEEWGIRVH